MPRAHLKPAQETRPVTHADRREMLLTGNLTMLIALEANGLEKPAGELVEKISAGLSRKPAAQPEPLGRVSLPDEERGRSEYDLKRLDQINARLLRGYKNRKDATADDQREADLRRRDELERELSRRSEERRLAQALAETEELAQARGAKVETDKAGVRRILDHDPIAALTWLSNDQDAAAKAIRDAYEMRSTDAGALEYTGMPRGQHDHERFVAKRYERAAATMLIEQVATAIMAGVFRSKRGAIILVRTHARFEAEKVAPHVALSLIRAVCGQGMTLTSQGAGRAYARNQKALALGLDVAHEVIHG